MIQIANNIQDLHNLLNDTMPDVVCGVLLEIMEKDDLLSENLDEDNKSEFAATIEQIAEVLATEQNEN